MRVLVVEDEAALAQQLEERLSADGMVVDRASDGREAIYYGEEFDYDVAVIDLGLPKIDGVAVIRHLREVERRYPILILTARDSWQDKVTGLEAGADDYLAKPFQYEELLARLKALVRRASGFASPVLRIGSVDLDTVAKEVRVSGERIDLTAYEYNLLEYLMLHPNKVVSKTELTEHLYAQDFERDSNVIEVFVGRLRRKLDPSGEMRPITTIRGQGYRLALE
ncbi:MAG: response regulator transcription factor [Gammaproteobacteria bacterium]|nr:response regulator transcription factor [Gammaproteobacteria bacterium]